MAGRLMALAKKMLNWVAGIRPGHPLCALVLAAVVAVGTGAPVDVAAGTADAGPQPADANAVDSAAVTDGAQADSAAHAVMELGEDVFAFRLEVAGRVFALPGPLAEWLDAGWAAQVRADVLAPGEGAELELVMDGRRVVVRLEGGTQVALPLADCAVVEVRAAEEDGPEILLPGGLGYGTARQAVLAACGVADEEAEDSGALQYSVGRRAGLLFAFDGGEWVRAVTVWNRVARPQAPGAETLPAEVLAYRAPAEMASDWRDFVVRYGGDLYALPAPVAAFLENGWALRDTGSVPAGGWMMRVCLEKGTQVLRTTLYNTSGAEQPLEGCFVTMVESAPVSARIPLELADGLHQDSSLEEIVAAWGEPDVVDRTGLGTRDRVYLHEGGKVVFRFEREEEKLVDVEVWGA